MEVLANLLGSPKITLFTLSYSTFTSPSVLNAMFLQGFNASKPLPSEYISLVISTYYKVEEQGVLAVYDDFLSTGPVYHNLVDLDKRHNR